MSQAIQAERVRTIEISVNNKPVSMPDERGRDEATGGDQGGSHCPRCGHPAEFPSLSEARIQARACSG